MTIDIIFLKKINTQINLTKEINVANDVLKFYIDIYYKNHELGLIFSKSYWNINNILFLV